MANLPKHMATEPARVIGQFSFTADGGDVRTERFERVRLAVLKAFGAAAKAEGFDAGFVIKVHTCSPKAFEAKHRRLFNYGVKS